MSKGGASDAKKNSPEIAPDVWALPHTTPNLAEKGARAGMFTTEERAPEKPATKRPTTDEPLDESPTAEESTSERSVAESPDLATLRPDDFSHEQSIVVKLDEGLAVFSSCSHCGPDVVMTEVHQFMPDQPIRALIGGFHLYDTPDEEVRALAGRMKNEGIELAYTGHCTGERAFKIVATLSFIMQAIVDILSCMPYISVMLQRIYVHKMKGSPCQARKTYA